MQIEYKVIPTKMYSGNLQFKETNYLIYLKKRPITTLAQLFNTA